MSPLCFFQACAHILDRIWFWRKLPGVAVCSLAGEFFHRSEAKQTSNSMMRKAVEPFHSKCFHRTGRVNNSFVSAPLLGFGCSTIPPRLMADRIGTPPQERILKIELLLYLLFKELLLCPVGLEPCLYPCSTCCLPG